MARPNQGATLPRQPIPRIAVTDIEHHGDHGLWRGNVNCDYLGYSILRALNIGTGIDRTECFGEYKFINDEVSCSEITFKYCERVHVEPLENHRWLHRSLKNLINEKERVI